MGCLGLCDSVARFETCESPLLWVPLFDMWGMIIIHPTSQTGDFQAGWRECGGGRWQKGLEGEGLCNGRGSCVLQEATLWTPSL